MASRLIAVAFGLVSACTSHVSGVPGSPDAAGPSCCSGRCLPGVPSCFASLDGGADGAGAEGEGESDAGSASDGPTGTLNAPRDAALADGPAADAPAADAGAGDAADSEAESEGATTCGAPGCCSLFPTLPCSSDSNCPGVCAGDGPTAGEYCPSVGPTASACAYCSISLMPSYDCACDASAGICIAPDCVPSACIGS